MSGDVKAAAALIGSGVVLLLGGFAIGTAVAEAREPEPVTITQVEERIVTERVEVPKVTTLEVIKEVEPQPEFKLSANDRELIARVVYAEAGWEDMVGKRLVVDVILNRVRSPHFPDTVHEVVYQKGQFIMAATYTPSCMEAVDAEIYGRLDEYIAWFCADDYICYGQQAYQHGGHYFSWLPEEWIQEEVME